MDEADFLKAFMGVDLLAVEGVAKIVGRAEATAFQEMLVAGLTEDQALKVIRATIHSVVSASLSAVYQSAAFKKEEEKK